MDKNSVIGAGNLYFNTIDYVVFAALLVLSSLIGIYYGFLAKNKQDNTAEYLLGNKQITLLPISISLIASYVLFLLFYGGLCIIQFNQLKFNL